MPILKLPKVSCDSHMSNDGVRNTVIRNCFISILQNLHFADNQTIDQSHKACKMCIVINHLIKAFQDPMSDAER